ncbi:MAG: hypothetical protein V1712_04325 [Patescibacteria group bacterium]
MNSSLPLSSLITKLNSPRWALIIVALAYAIFIITRLNFCQLDISCFVVAGSHYVDRNAAPQSLSILSDSYGYDGQFYYRLALNPFTNKWVENGIRFDNAPYRHQRILYPLIIWFLSFGSVNLVPFLMVFFNYIVLCLIAWLGARYAAMFNRHALWGMALAFYPEFIFSLSRNLTEIIEVCLIIAGLYAIRQRKWVGATIFLLLGVFARETSIIVALAVLASNLLAKLPLLAKWKIERIYPWYVWAVPLGSYGVWQSLLWYVWGSPPLSGATRVLGLPFLGLFSNFHFIEFAQQINQLLWLATIFLCLLVFVVLVAIRSSQANSVEFLSWLGFLFLISSVPVVWQECGFLRAAAGFYALSTIILFGSLTKLKFPILLFTLYLWWLEFSLYRLF